MEQNTTSVVIEQQGENKKRGALAVILAVAFVAMLGIGSTFAYLTWTGNQTPNRFTTNTELSGDLVEPAWTSAVTTAMKSEKTAEIASDGTVIPANAGLTKKGEVIAKDPYVVNTSKGTKEANKGYAYAAVRLTFQYWLKDKDTDSTVDAQGRVSEQGHYENMSVAQVKNLLNVYAFTTETEYDENGTVAGMNVDENWIKVDASGAKDNSITNSDAYLEGTGGQIYYVYQYALGPQTEDTISTYPKAAAATADAEKGVPGAGVVGTSTTTSLFSSVIQCADEASTTTYYGDLMSSLKVAGTQAPGWRVLIDNTMAYATPKTSDSASNKADVITDNTVGTSAMPALIEAFDGITVEETGASPTNETYNYGGIAPHGSGAASGITTNDTDATLGYVLPEAYWEK